MEKFVSTVFSKMQPNSFENIILSTAYLPPISYFTAISRANSVFIETHEHFVKQTYRNRCRIATANGVKELTIPIESNNGIKNPIRDTRISRHEDWQKIHWRTFDTAYRNSPFFEYYKDDFRPFYEKEWKFLWDYNQDLLTLVFELLDIQPTVQLTENYINRDKKAADLREKIHPKRESISTTKEYYQVFEQKHQFIPDLSIVDLLFNMGNESILTIEKSKLHI
jgi:hypothetical protein